MRAKKSPRLRSSAGVLALMSHALMGAGLGLTFSFALILFNPAVASLLKHSGDPELTVLVVTVATTFSIGATLTGLVFILAQDKES